MITNDDRRCAICVNVCVCVMSLCAIQHSKDGDKNLSLDKITQMETIENCLFVLQNHWPIITMEIAHFAMSSILRHFPHTPIDTYIGMHVSHT